MYPYFLLGPEAQVPHAHNNSLQVAVDLGIPGLVAYLALLASFGLCAWQVYRSSESHSIRLLAAGLVAGKGEWSGFPWCRSATLGYTSTS